MVADTDAIVWLHQMCLDVYKFKSYDEVLEIYNKFNLFFHLNCLVATYSLHFECVLICLITGISPHPDVGVPGTELGMKAIGIFFVLQFRKHLIPP